MVFVIVEHWVFNRTPIEFNSDASMTFNNGQTQLNAFATPTINIFDLHPSRMKIWANFTQLKHIFDTSEDGLADANLIDLDQFYTKTETDELLDQKQDKLIDKKTIKTINDKSILGEGDFLIDKTEVGLSNVDNTSDKDKPISTTAQNALNAKENALNAKRLMEFFEEDEFYLTEGGTKIGNGPWGESSILNRTIVQDTTYPDLTTINKTLLGAINEIFAKSSGEPGWIEGEYKWMYIGSTMPQGWKKIKYNIPSFLIFSDTGPGVTSIKLSNNNDGDYYSLISCDLWIYDPNNKYSDSETINPKMISTQPLKEEK